MGKFVRHQSRRDCLESTSISLLDRPLDFVHEDHLRERQICALIDEIADCDAPDPEIIATVLKFLTEDFPLHLQDEEDDLFPLLRRRCKPEDEIGKVIARLHADHDHADTESMEVVEILRELRSNPRPIKDTDKKALLSFSKHSRRHLILENAVILPFARLRLLATDLETLYIRMCQRRGIDHRQGGRHVEGLA